MEMKSRTVCRPYLKRTLCFRLRMISEKCRFDHRYYLRHSRENKCTDLDTAETMDEYRTGKPTLNICTGAINNKGSRPFAQSSDEGPQEKQVPTRCRGEMHSELLRNHSKYAENFDKQSRLMPSPHPVRVVKLFLKAWRYLGGPTESMRRSSHVILSACHLCKVYGSCNKIIFPLWQKRFLKDPLLVYFMVVVLIKEGRSGEAIKLLEITFLMIKQKR